MQIPILSSERPSGDLWMRHANVRIDQRFAYHKCFRIRTKKCKFLYYQVMSVFGPMQKKVVMVVDRSGIHRARKLASTLEHYKDKFELHFLPAHSGHHLNPIEGFWRRMKEVIGAGRCFGDLHQLYQRTRQVLMAHQQRPIYEFAW